jgi:hypothetical protein
MSHREEDGGSHFANSGKQALVVRVTDNDFQRDVLDKLGRLETKMDMLVGNGQPGRIKLMEDRLVQLERNDVKRSVYERLINAALSVAISAAIALLNRVTLR